MSGYLAIDGERVGLLATALDDALDDAATWQLDDPAAGDARLAVRRAVAAFAEWPARLAAVRGTAALTELFSWGAGDERWGSLVPVPGRVLVIDRRPPGTHADRLLLAVALGTRWAGAGSTGFRPEDWLAALAPLGGDPEALAVLLATLGPATVGDVLDEIAFLLRSAPADGAPGGPTMSALVEVTMLLGGGLRTTAPGDGPTLATVTADADPIVAALLVRGALTVGAGSPTPSDMVEPGLASVAATTLERLFTVDPFWRVGAAGLLAALASRPAAAREVLLDLEPVDRAIALLDVDPVAAGAFLRAATDPRSFTPDEARPAVLAAIEVLGGFGAATDHPAGTRPTPGVPEDPFPLHGWWRDIADGVWRPSPYTVVPAGLGTVLAPWLPFLVAPGGRADWTPGAVAPWALAGRDDELTQALVVTMSDETEALAMRVAAARYLAQVTAATTTGEADLEHAAYLAGGVEDAARSAGFDAIVTRTEQIAELEAIVGLPFNFVPMELSLPMGVAIGAAAATAAPDLRTAMAAGERAGADVAVSLGLGAVAAWSAAHAPHATPFVPPPPADDTDTDAGDRADRRAHEIAAALREWAERELPPNEAAAVLARYETTRQAAFEGTGLVAG